MVEQPGGGAASWVTTRTLYRMIDERQLPAYKMGRVLRLRTQDVDVFIESCRVEPGTLANLYPPPRRNAAHDDGDADDDDPDLDDAG